MKNFLKLFLTYFFIFFFFTLIYLFLFNTPIFSSQKVLFYRGIVLLIIATVINSILLLITRRILKTNLETLIAAILVSASINLSLFVVLPVTFERSVTMFLFNTLKNGSDNNCKGLTKSQLEEKLINEYIINKAIDKRVYEQSIIGLISKNNQCYQLTPRALDFLKITEIIGKLYGFKN